MSAPVKNIILNGTYSSNINVDYVQNIPIFFQKKEMLGFLT